MLGMQELILILLIVVVVFGAKRIPEIMGGLGEGIKSFKKALETDDVMPAQPLETNIKRGPGSPEEDAVSSAGMPNKGTGA